MNSSLAIPSQSMALLDRITTDWRRFSSGLWRIPEGDISAAYCADTFPKIKVFTHEGRLFTNCGCHFSRMVHAAADCYPLIPSDEYMGPEPAQYTYEGRAARFQGEPIKLGRKVVFAASDPSVFEWKHLFRVLYADGGLFAKNATYLEFLKKRSEPESGNEGVAHAEEMTECAARMMPSTQAGMQNMLIGSIQPAEAGAKANQMDLGF